MAKNNSTIVTKVKKYYGNDLLEQLHIPRADANIYHNSNRTDVVSFIGYGSFGQSTQYAWDFIVAHYLSGKNLSNNPRYIDYAKINTDTQLGNNPQNISYITGVGSRSPKHPLVNESYYADAGLPPYPGVPVFGPMSHMSAGNSYGAAVQSKNNLYPFGANENDPYPLLRRYYDCQQNPENSEYGINHIAMVSSVFGFFKSTPAPLPTAINSNSDYNKNGVVLRNFPNPFSENTTISFLLPESGKVSLCIYNMYGQKVQSLPEENLVKGNHDVNMEGSHLPSGSYICVLQTPWGNKTTQMIIIK